MAPRGAAGRSARRARLRTGRARLAHLHSRELAAVRALASLAGVEQIPPLAALDHRAEPSAERRAEPAERRVGDRVAVHAIAPRVSEPARGVQGAAAAAEAEEERDQAGARRARRADLQ